MNQLEEEFRRLEVECGTESSEQTARMYEIGFRQKANKNLSVI